MSLITDTFPLVCSYAAANPQLTLRVTVGSDKKPIIVMSNGTSEVDVTPLFSKWHFELGVPLKINVLSNDDFKSLLDRLDGRRRMVL